MLLHNKIQLVQKQEQLRDEENCYSLSFRANPVISFKTSSTDFISILSFNINEPFQNNISSHFDEFRK